MRVVFVSDHFSTPDEPGILRTWQLTRHLCEQGDQVTVIAPRDHYVFPGSTRRTTPLSDGLRLVSLASPPLDRGRVSSRLRYYLAQLLGATKQAWQAGPCDVVVAGQTPSLLSIGPYLVARARRVPFVLDERDLALDAAAELRLLPAPVLAVARGVERFLHRRADGVVAVTPGLGRVLEQRGVGPDRLWLVPNGLDIAHDDRTPDPRRLRSELGWEGKVVVLYAGGLGRAYDLGLVLDALARVQASELLLAVLGEGENKAVYREKAKAQGLAVQFLDPRPKREVPAFCAASDICVLPLRAMARSSYVLSNKLFDYLGSGRPVVATGPGDTADLLHEANAGVVVAAGDAEAMASALGALARDPARRADMGRSGRAFVEAHWRREEFARRFREALAVTVDRARSGPSPSAAGERERIERVYRRYDTDPRAQAKRSASNAGVRAIAAQRWTALRRALEGLPAVDRPAVLDVGCGAGDDLHRIGRLWAGRGVRLHGIDVLADRIEQARARVPDAELLVGSAHQLPFPDGCFEVVLAGTLFSSILDPAVRRTVAKEVLRVLAPGGTVLSYDLRLPNPANRHTRPISRGELGRLFPGCRVEARSLTVLPPLARRLGVAVPFAYPALHRLRFLRSHNLVTVSRQATGPTLFVAHAQHRFPNMTVNQRLRAVSTLGPVDVLTCYPDAFPDDVKASVRVIGCPLSSRVGNTTLKLSLFTFEALIWALLHPGRYRLVYCFQDSSALVGWALRSRGTRWVLDAVDDPAMELANAVERGQPVKSTALRARDALLRLLVPRADVVCAIGTRLDDGLPAMLTRSYGADPQKIVPLHQAIDVRAVAEGRERVPRDFGPRALFVGFVSPLRGVDTLLEAGRILRQRGVPLEIELVGHLQHHDRAWLDRFDRDNPGLVRYRGVLPSERTLECMARTTVGVLPFPARREMRAAQAVTGVEYLAVGTPLVGTRLPWMLSLIEEGTNGFLVEPGDAEGMAEAIAAVVGDPARARRMSEAAHARAERFDVGHVNRRLAKALCP